MQILIENLQQAFAWTPAWAISFIVLALAFVIGVLIQRVVFRVLTRLTANRDLFWRSLVQRTYHPLRLAILTWTLSIGTTIAPLSDRATGLMRHALLLCFVVLLGWMARTALHIWVTVYLRRFKLDAEDNLLARKHVTQSRIMERVAASGIIALTASAVLMSFPAVRQYGVSLLASAGVAGIVLGLALQPMLKNLFAGLQLAITQPIRIDDALIVEGEFGHVEEITSTYVVVKLWDWRRLVLPLNYFIEKPFQNWTREGAALIGTVMVYLDYSVPVSTLRQKTEEIVKSAPLWDGKVFNLAVTDLKDQVMEIRILVSATSAGKTFDLRCYVREKLMEYIQQSHPDALPRLRIRQAEKTGAREAVEA